MSASTSALLTGVAVGTALIGAVAVAAPTAPVTGWRPLPTLAEPAVDALTGTALTGTAEAWGDPSIGRFALVQDYASPEPVADTAAALADVHASLRATLEQSGASIDSWDVTRDESVAVFRLGTFQGTVRTRATIESNGTLRARSTLCFYNERERDRSGQRCKRFLDSL